MKTLLLAFCMVTCAWAQDLTWQDLSAENRQARFVLLNPYNPQIIYLAAKNAVFETGDKGKNWKRILSIRGKDSLVNFLSFHPLNNNFLYAATQSGLFYSRNCGRSWERIFRGKGDLENNCATVLSLPDLLYLGSKAGLFLSRNNGRQWERVAGKLGRSNIFSLAASLKEPDIAYVACAEGVFKTQNAGKSWEKIFAQGHGAEFGETEIEDDKPQEAEDDSTPKFIALNPENINKLYLATGMGIYESLDKGQSWQALSDYGLLSKQAEYLYVSAHSRIYLANKSGAFEYRDGRWRELTFGLSFKEIRSLAQDSLGDLYLACDSGLFKSRENLEQYQQPKASARNYPVIRQVQDAAIKYAEVEPQKIIRWRKQAAARAIFPKLSASVNRDASDLWHWESGSTAKTGDDVLIKGRDSLGWDVTLSWDLGELVWSDVQTAIDTRSRLMVQLREDILDEVTKIYYERIRVIQELDSLSLEERQKRAEKELRLEELGAYLDGLTGGYFSKQAKK